MEKAAITIAKEVIPYCYNSLVAALYGESGVLRLS